MIKHQIKETLSQYLKEINLSINALEKLCGFSGRYFHKMNYEIPNKKIDTILSVLPNLNREWLITGEGNMRLGGEDITVSMYAPLKDKDTATSSREEIMNRLEKILLLNGMTPRDFEKKIHTFHGIWDNAKKRGSDRAVYDWVKCVLNEYPGYSYDWVLFGKGSMKLQKNTLPLYNISTIADREVEVEQYYLPVFLGADLLFTLPADSLDKKLLRGDIVACKTINLSSTEVINLSKQYLVIAQNEDPFVAHIRLDEGNIAIIDKDGQQVFQANTSSLIYIGQIIGNIAIQ